MTYHGPAAAPRLARRFHRGRMARGRAGGESFCTKASLILALLAVMMGGTCGGGGVSSNVQRQLAAQISPGSLTFGNQNLRTTSGPQAVTLKNPANVPLTISSIAVSANFGENNNCGSSVAANSSCTIDVTFAPTVTGALTGTLTITDNSAGVAGSTQTVSLTGSGVLSTVSFSASSLTFASQASGVTSAPQTETVTNSGDVNLIISTVAISGANASDFAISSDGCSGATLAPTKTCSVDVTFTPSAAANRTALLSLHDSAGDSPQTVTLMGSENNPLAGVYTQRYDNARSGANTNETLLTPSNVNVDQFGKLFSLPVDGQVYAQPLYVKNVSIPNRGTHNVVYVATQNDSVYAFDADGQSTTPLWQTSFLNSAAGVTTVPCADVYGTGIGACEISPEIGITSTPVIDPSTGTLYVTAKTREPLGSNSCSNNGMYNYCYRLHALDITTGAEKFGGPAIISASVPGTGYDNVNGTVTFTGFRHLQRPGLLLLNGTLYIGFGSHRDLDSYHGWLMAYNAGTLQQEAVFCTTPNGEEGAIWQGGGGISADTNSPPNIFAVIANGTFDRNSGGVDYGDSVLRIQLQSGQFRVMDYFTPQNELTLAEDDLDLGSSPALILPDQPGTHPHLLAMGGKDGRIWLLNRDSLGQFTSNDAGAVEEIPEVGSDALFGGMTYWDGNLYVQEVGSGVNQFSLSNGLMPQSPSFSSETEYGGSPNPIPVVSANGTTNGVMWIVSRDSNTGAAILWALDATDVSNAELYDSLQAPNNRDQAGAYVKFVIPTVANGKVYVGTATEVAVYGLLP